MQMIWNGGRSCVLPCCIHPCQRANVQHAKHCSTCAAAILHTGTLALPLSLPLASRWAAIYHHALSTSFAKEYKMWPALDSVYGRAYLSTNQTCSSGMVRLVALKFLHDAGTFRQLVNKLLGIIQRILRICLLESSHLSSKRQACQMHRPAGSKGGSCSSAGLPCAIQCCSASCNGSGAAAQEH